MLLTQHSEEDVTFRPDEAEVRPDEKECTVCHYLHFHKISCPNCYPLTKTEYEKLSG
jgi:hypothetical protein